MEINENVAVDKAINYLKSLPQESLENPESPRLEAIHRLNGNWVIVLSYLTKSAKKEGDDASDLMKSKIGDLLRYRRQFKEFYVDVNSGQVIVMRTP